jgi:hypothetical protein
MFKWCHRAVIIMVSSEQAASETTELKKKWKPDESSEFYKSVMLIGKQVAFETLEF